MMKFPSLLVFIALLPSIKAAPTGASACPGGMAAVGGPHLRDGAMNGTLSDGGVVVNIGNTTLTAGDTFDSTPGDVFDLTVQATDDAPIRGILVRLECQTDLTGALMSEDDLLQDASACAQDDNFVVGMTHTSNVDKTTLEMEIGLETPTTVSMDVTVVMANNADDGSTYYYDRFYFAAKYEACNICGELGQVGNPDGVIPLPPEFGLGVTEIDCATAAQVGASGQIAPDICALAPTLAAGICQCGVEPPPMTTDPPMGTDPPMTTDPPEGTTAPTMEPTSDAAAKLMSFWLAMLSFSLFVSMA